MIERSDVLLVESASSGREQSFEALANQFSSELHGVEKAEALLEVVAEWAGRHGPAAAAWVNTNTGGAIRQACLAEALAKWAEKDPEAALDFCLNLDPYTRSMVVDGLALTWAEHSPAVAAAAAEQLSAYDFGDEFSMLVARQWGENAPTEAAAWALGISDHNIRASAILELAEVWAANDLSAAQNWVNELADESDRNFAKRGIAFGLASQNPGVALNWIEENISDAKNREEHIANIAGSWGELDPDAVGNWLIGRPKNENTDVALAAYSRAVFEQDPLSALDIASQISDKQTKQSVMRGILEELVQLEGDSFRQWVSESDLSEPLKVEYGVRSGDGR